MICNVFILGHSPHANYHLAMAELFILVVVVVVVVVEVDLIMTESVMNE